MMNVYVSTTEVEQGLNMETLPAIYVLSTHWDREWYSHFQDFRYRLVHLMDRTITALGSGELRGPFYCDGQSIVLTDYLEVRPEQSGTVRSLLAEGRIKAGPWYVMPDEALVSGESLVRNLEYGRELVRSLGGTPSDSGFVCDIFGHNSQLPQIFSGFGIGCAFVWRGLNLPETANFNWVAADGTSLPAYRFGTVGYCDFLAKVRQKFKPGAPDPGMTPEEAVKAFLEHESSRARNAAAPAMLVFDGGDHLEFHATVNAALENQPGLTFGSLDDYTALVRNAHFPLTITGELRTAGEFPEQKDVQWLIPGVLSSRIWIKQENAACEIALTRRAEPLCVLGAMVLNREYPAGFLKVAWRWLLENHPHDSICGCSIDAVHRDMKYRFAQSATIAQRLSSETAKSLIASTVLAPEAGSDVLRIGLFNPTFETWTAPIEVELDFPTDWPSFNEFFGFEPLPSFRIFTAAGEEVPYWRISKTLRKRRKFTHGQYGVEGCEVIGVRVVLETPLPAGGYVVLYVKPGDGATRHVKHDSMVRAPQVLDNGVIRVEFEADGTMSVTELATGKRYEKWLRFEDDADIGDGWFHGIAANNRRIYSNAAQFELLADTPLLARYRVRTKMLLPECFDFRDMERSGRSAELEIVSDVTMKRDSATLEITSRIENDVCDHRLRVLFPSGAASAKEYFAASAFDTVVRPIALPDGHAWRELPVETTPQAGWFGVAADGRGAAVIAPGLPECAVVDDETRTLALTLFRSTCRTVETRGEPDGELTGMPLEFHYAVSVLKDGNVDAAGLTRESAAFAAGVFAEELTMREKLFRDETETLPGKVSGLEISGAVATTSLRQVAGEVELRMFNPTFQPTTACLVWPKAPVSCRMVRLDGSFLEKVSCRGAEMEIPVPAKRIVTLRLTFA